MTSVSRQDTQRGLSRGLLGLLAFGAGASVANLYYAQPLLATLAHFFDAPAHVGAIAVATQLGYTLGIFFVLPLGDLRERRYLIATLAGVLALALACCAVAQSLLMLIAASFFVGIGATVTQMLVPFAADLSPADQKTKAVGIVFSGILGGILLARTISGVLADLLGWRAVFVAASLLAVILGGLLFSVLPRVAPKSRQSYGSLVFSLFQLFGRHRALRNACLIQACMFAIFSAFWSMLSLHVAQPPFNMGADGAGAFGLVGIVGVFAANLSGRVIDRIGSGRALSIGLLGCILAFIVFMADQSLTGLIVGIILLDFSVSVVNLANQSSILALDASASSRINSIYVTAIFLGGAAGSFAGSIAWQKGGWPSVTLFGLVVAVVAALVHLRQYFSKPSGVAP